MDKEDWLNYAQKIETEIVQHKLLDKIQKTREGNHNNNKSNVNSLQEIWDEFEKIIKDAGKKFIPLKKIKRTNKPIYKDKGHTSSFKDLRKATKILSLIQKIQDNPEPSLLATIDKETEDLSKKYPLLIFKNPNKTSNISDTPWKEWINNLQENIQTIKEVNYREEAIIKEKEIKKAIEKRCLDLENNQKRMINSLTGQKKNNITLNRILIKDQQSIHISTDPQEVLKETAKYYKEAFKTRNSNYELLNEDWKKEYLPKSYIKKEWFTNLMDPITEEELNTTLKDLPNNKASGLSMISYEMLKRLGPRARKTLKEFFSLCLEKGTCPLSWKSSTIFPIPKSKDWECDLTNTRPIILLETSRKCFTKIITNRLSEICKRHNILAGPNYAGLPGESTQEPIQLLNNICEEAREKGKELWICFQDTAKAFDTVNLEMLQKAMKRIKIPNKAINFIINLFKNRTLKAITEYGLTQEIIAGDGLDQGETISPLLWRIFYDPLLNKIQKDPQLGYTMEVKWHQDLNHTKEETIKLRTAATAFMDDTTWIASSRSNMQKILEEAAIFYKANDSQINSKKSVLIAINAPKDNPNHSVLHRTQQRNLTKNRRK